MEKTYIPQIAKKTIHKLAEEQFLSKCKGGQEQNFKGYVVKVENIQMQLQDAERTLEECIVDIMSN